MARMRSTTEQELPLSTYDFERHEPTSVIQVSKVAQYPAFKIRTTSLSLIPCKWHVSPSRFHMFRFETSKIKCDPWHR